MSVFGHASGCSVAGGPYSGRVRDSERCIVTGGKHILALPKEALLISESSKHEKNSLRS